MKYPKVRLIYDRKKRGSEDIPAAVEIEVSFLRKRKWIATGVLLLPSQWNADKEVAVGMDNAENNIRIENMFKPVRDCINGLMLRGEEFTWEHLESAIFEGRNDGSFIKFAEERIESRKDIADGTRRNHRKIITALTEFKKMTMFSEVTRANILEFDEWLHGKDYAQVTIHSYHKFLKVYLHEAMVKGLIKNDPYLGLRIEQGRSPQRKYLTDDEMSKIRDCKCLTPSLRKVRDMFMFQCYTGLAYADLKKFDFAKVVERDGKFILHDTRTKSKIDFYIVLLPPAVEILRRYDFKLPMMTNEQYNMRLKAVATCAGIEKSVSSHMARHSFAVSSLNAGIPMEVVSRMLGHTNVRTTQIYAKVINKTVEDAFDILNNHINRDLNVKLIN